MYSAAVASYRLDFLQSARYATLAGRQEGSCDREGGQARDSSTDDLPPILNGPATPQLPPFPFTMSIFTGVPGAS